MWLLSKRGALQRTVYVLATRGGRRQTSREATRSSSARDIGGVALVAEVGWVGVLRIIRFRHFVVGVMLYRRHRGGRPAGEGRSACHTEPLHLLLGLVLVARRHVTVLACGAVVGDGLAVAATDLLHSFLVLQCLPHQTLGLRVLQRAVADGAPSGHLLTHRRM